MSVRQSRLVVATVFVAQMTAVGTATCQSYGSGAGMWSIGAAVAELGVRTAERAELGGTRDVVRKPARRERVRARDLEQREASLGVNEWGGEVIELE